MRIMKIGITKEMLADERRVAAVPGTVVQMVHAGMEVLVESGAGMYALNEDEEYKKAGAKMQSSYDQVLHQADVVLKVQRPIFDYISGHQETHFMKENAILIGLLSPLNNLDIIDRLNEKKLTAFSLDLMPRNANTQSMDALGSMSKIAGYKSVIIAAYYLGKLIPTLTTSGPAVQRTRVLVIGAGVAGLEAIKTAKQLDGDVTALDIKASVAEQVKNLGAEFVSMSGSFESDEGQAVLREYIKEADVVISTAHIPGQRAPILITEEMVQEMKPGSVIVDLAIEQKGNCALTESGKVIVKNGVTIIGFLNIPSTMPIQASKLYAENIWNFLRRILPDGRSIQIDPTDESIMSCLVTQNGETVHPVIKQALRQRA